MRNYLDDKSDGISKNPKRLTDNNKTFIYTGILTAFVTAAMALVDLLLNKYEYWGDILISIYKTLIPTVITFLATIIVNNLVAIRKGKYLHGNIIGLIVLLLVPVFYVVTLVIDDLVPLIITGVLGVFAAVVAVWAHFESPNE